MKTWQWSVVALACLAAAACRSDPNIPYLERDLRLQEDKIYQLKALREDDEAVLDSCRRENATLRKRLAEAEESGSGAPKAPRSSGESPSAPRWSGPAGTPGPLVNPPAVDLGEPSKDVPETFKPRAKSKPAERSIAPDADSEAPPAKIDTEAPRARPAVKKPVAAAPADDTAVSGPALLPGAADEQPAETPRTVTAPVSVPAKTGTPPSAQPAKPTADNKQVQKIVLNRLLTGGYNTSGRSGDDGVIVVIEPRNAKGEVLAAPGELSVVVFDPALDGEASRIARWDFTADEVAARFRKTVVANGVQLEMPWPADPPQNEDLHVFVRYTTCDGRKLEADKPIKVKLPIEVVERAAAAAERARADKARAKEPAASSESATASEGASRSGNWRPSSAPTVRVPTAPTPRAASRSSRGSDTTAAARPVWSPTRQ
jgi:hypothetical protein